MKPVDWFKHLPAAESDFHFEDPRHIHSFSKAKPYAHARAEAAAAIEDQYLSDTIDAKGFYQGLALLGFDYYEILGRQEALDSMAGQDAYSRLLHSQLPRSRFEAIARRFDVVASRLGLKRKAS